MIMAASGIYGPEIWTYSVSDLLGHSEIFGDHSLRDMWVNILLFSFLTAHLPACVNNVVKARKRDNLPVLPVFAEWTPMIVYTASICVWLSSPYSTLLKQNRVVLFCLTMSFVFGRMTTKIILAHLTRQPFPYWTVMLLPLVGGAFLGNLPRFGFPAITAEYELLYLRAYFVFAVIVYFRWAALVINAICSYLDIRCFTIAEMPKANGVTKFGPVGGEKKRAVGLVDGFANGVKKE